MNFDIATGYRDLIFSKSVRPMEIKEETKNWKLLQGYVYVMSKKFRPFPDDPERLLIKIGYSDFEADDGRDKYLQRLQTHKTSLISFKVHRIYLYTDGGASTLKGKAYDAEQNLHRLVVDTYNPPSVRITFDQKGTDREKPRPTEWFWVKNGKRGLEKMLKWMDEQIFNNMPYPAIHGTRFTGDGPNDYQYILPDVEYPDRGQQMTRFEINPESGTVKERRDLARTSKSVHAKRKGQKEMQLDRIEKDRVRKEKEKAIKAEGRRLAKTQAEWSKIFKGQKFYDKNMGVDNYGRKDDGKYPNKKVTKVSSWKRGMYLVHYTIDTIPRLLAKIPEDDLKFHTDEIPLHEAFDLKDFAHLKKKYKVNYEYFKDKFNYDPNVNLEDD